MPLKRNSRRDFTANMSIPAAAVDTKEDATDTVKGMKKEDAAADIATKDTTKTADAADMATDTEKDTATKADATDMAKTRNTTADAAGNAIKG